MLQFDYSYPIGGGVGFGGAGLGGGYGGGLGGFGGGYAISSFYHFNCVLLKST